MMYKRHLNQINLLDDPEYFGGIALDPDNEWVKLAKLIPWHKFEEEYAASFPSGTGQPACSFRMALGALLIKERYQFSDEETVAHITMNPYLQYFIGLEAFTQKSPFDQSMMTRFRKRISTRTLQEVNDIIIGRPPERDEDHDDNDNNDSSSGDNKGTLILDATCAPQYIRFPTDASLLNEARLNAEAIIDVLHENGLTEGKKKPRTYREKAKRQYNGFSKSRKKTMKSIRKAIRRQLGYLKRDLGIIERIKEKHSECSKYLPKWLQERLPIIRILYEQQQEMFSTNTRRVDDRIVSLSQPWVRPIVRGKQNADVEFGAKVEMSDVNGFLRVEDLRWNAFNESKTLQTSVENYRKAYGHYPERVLADKIFRTRENLSYCKEHNIHLNGPRLGKPNSDSAIRRQELHLEWIESSERGDIERRFGIDKRCYSLGCITAKLQHTSEVMIYLSVLMLNLQKRLRLLLRIFFRFYFQPNFLLLVQ
jgi:hypothetical protein